MAAHTSFEPSKLQEEHLHFLLDSVRDWQIQHGSLIKAPPNSGITLARPIGATLFPSNFPLACFEEARGIQRIYNRLYVAIAADEKWLFNTMER